MDISRFTLLARSSRLADTHLFLKQKQTQQTQWNPLVFPQHALSFLILSPLSEVSAEHLVKRKPSMRLGPDFSSKLRRARHELDTHISRYNS